MSHSYRFQHSRVELNRIQSNFDTTYDIADSHYPVSWDYAFRVIWSFSFFYSIYILAPLGGGGQKHPLATQVIDTSYALLNYANLTKSRWLRD